MAAFEQPPFVTFDYANWIATYPEMAGVNSTQAGIWFTLAGAYFQNAQCNPAAGVPGLMLILLNMVTAHLAWILCFRDAVTGLPSSTGTVVPSPLVGRINSASEGSVSVGTEYQMSGSPSEAFFTQTKYGAMFWQATAQFRTAIYSARPTVVVDSIFPLRPGAGRGNFY